MKAQSIPPAALEDPNAVEMARVWVAKQGLHCVLNIGVYQDSGIPETRAWGVILADMARHVSNALVEGGWGDDKTEALSLIRQSMAKELDAPTSKTAGKFDGTPKQ